VCVYNLVSTLWNKVFGMRNGWLCCGNCNGVGSGMYVCVICRVLVVCNKWCGGGWCGVLW